MAAIKKNNRKTRRYAFRVVLLVSTLVFTVVGLICLGIINAKILSTQVQIKYYNDAIADAQHQHNLYYSAYLKTPLATEKLKLAEDYDIKVTQLRDERAQLISGFQGNHITAWAVRNEGDLGTIIIAFSGFGFIIFMIFILWPTSNNTELSEKEILCSLKNDFKSPWNHKDYKTCFRILWKMIVCLRNSLHLLEKILIAEEWLLHHLFYWIGFVGSKIFFFLHVRFSNMAERNSEKKKFDNQTFQTDKIQSKTTCKIVPIGKNGTDE